jgi:hypothetical protein
MEMDDKDRRAWARLLRTMATTIDAMSLNSDDLRKLADYLNPPDVPEPSRSSHYS